VPYGSALFNWAVRRRLATQTFEHLKRFGIIYSSAKHDFNHAASTHRFSMPDAVLAYVIARRLATELYALANLRTSLDSELGGHDCRRKRSRRARRVRRIRRARVPDSKVQAAVSP